MTKSVKIGYAFRIAVILTTIFCFVSFVTLVTGTIASDDFLGEETISSLHTATIFYNLTFFGTFVCFVFSCVAQAFCKKISVFARTFLVGFEMGLLAFGFKVNYLLNFSARVIKKFGDLDKYTDEEIADAMNISEKEIEEITEFLRSDPPIEPYVLALVAGIVVFALLTFTSLHWLIKKKTENVTFDQMFN